MTTTTISSPYVFPSDGYVVLSASQSSSTYIRGRIYDRVNNDFDISVGYNKGNSYFALFVRKGMKYATITNDNSGLAQFIPLV